MAYQRPQLLIDVCGNVGNRTRLGREFGHIHPQPTGGSLHLRLREGHATEVVEKGWGEHHPFALDGSMPNLIMVYAPRDADDLNVVMTIVKAAVDYATSDA